MELNMHALYRLLFVLCWVGCTFPAWSLGPSTVIAPETRDVQTQQLQWSYLLDSSDALDFEQVSSPDFQDRFLEGSGKPRFGYIKGALWLRLRLAVPETSNQAAAMRWLEFQSAVIDDLTLYIPTNTGGPLVRISGDWNKMALRDLDYRNPAFSIGPELWRNHDSITVYARARGHNSMTFGLALWETPTLISRIAKEYSVFGLFLAVHLVLVLSSLWFFASTRDLAYGFFSLYTLINLIAAATAEGFAYQYLLSDAPALNDFLTFASYVMGAPAGLIFILAYSGLLFPKGSRLTWGLILLEGVIALISIMMSLLNEPTWLRPWFAIWNIFLVVVSTLLLIWQTYYHRNKSARRLLFCTLPFLAAVILRMARNLGHIESNYLSDNAHYAAMLIYMLALNYVMSLHYKDIRLEKKKIEQALQREYLEKMRQNQFLMTVSHELRTPLSIIHATTQNLHIGAADADNRTQARYEKIMRATRRMIRVLESYLDHPQKAGSDLLKPKRVPTHLESLLRDAVRAAQAIADGHQIQLETQDLPEVYECDSILLQLAIRTLLDNAIKYSPAGSLVQMSASASTDSISIEIQDQGPGIAPSEWQRVFEPYYRSDDVQHLPGNGLGLPLARRVIEMEGGTLVVAPSKSPGCRIVITLPLRLPRPTDIKHPTGTDAVAI